QSEPAIYFLVLAARLRLQGDAQGYEQISQEENLSAILQTVVRPNDRVLGRFYFKNSNRNNLTTVSLFLFSTNEKTLPLWCRRVFFLPFIFLSLVGSVSVPSSAHSSRPKLRAPRWRYPR